MAEQESILDSSALWDSKGHFIGLTEAQVATLGPNERACYDDCARASVTLQEAEAHATTAEQLLFQKVRELRAAEYALEHAPGKPDRISLVRDMIAVTQSGGR